MEITINGRNLGVTDRFREYATEKAEKIDHLAEKAIAFEVKVSRHHETRGSSGDDRVELTLIGPGPLVRAESAGSDKYVAFDLAMAKIVERIRQSKDRNKVHRGKHRPVSLREASADGFSVVDITPVSPDVLEKVRDGRDPGAGRAKQAEEDYSPVVIRHKVFPTSPHDGRRTPSTTWSSSDTTSSCSSTAETDRPSVVYRRKGWDYGVIGLEDDSRELAEDRAAPVRRRGSSRRSFPSCVLVRLRLGNALFGVPPVGTCPTT